MNDFESDTIQINLLTTDDAETLYQLIDSSREKLTNLVWAKNSTLQTTLEFITNKTVSVDKVYGIFWNGQLTGVLELRDKGSFLELGYWLGYRYQGLGLMKNAVKKLVEENIKRNTIVAHIRETNKSSCKVLEYAGLVYDHTEVFNNENWLHLKRNKEI